MYLFIYMRLVFHRRDSSQIEAYMCSNQTNDTQVLLGATVGVQRWILGCQCKNLCILLPRQCSGCVECSLETNCAVVPYVSSALQGHSCLKITAPARSAGSGGSANTAAKQRSHKHAIKQCPTGIHERMPGSRQHGRFLRLVIHAVSVHVFRAYNHWRVDT